MPIRDDRPARPIRLRLAEVAQAQGITTVPDLARKMGATAAVNPMKQSLPEVMKELGMTEGFDVGDFGTTKDNFGHVQYSASQTTVAQTVVNYLNKVGLNAKGKARGNTPGTDQRHSMAYASTVDLDEAYHAGEMCAELAATGQSGYMATILRKPGPIYSVYYDKAPLDKVANSERFDAEKRKVASKNAMVLYANMGQRDKMNSQYRVYVSLKPSDEEKTSADYLIATYDYKQWNPKGGDTGQNRTTRLAAQSALVPSAPVSRRSARKASAAFSAWSSTLVAWWPRGSLPKSVASSWCESHVSGCQLDCSPERNAHAMPSPERPACTCGFSVT